MRPEPKVALPERAWKRNEPLTLEVDLITRLFGGGAAAKELDDVCWLRSPAVKSAIRSWWRAAKPHEHKSIATLREEEARIFGAPGTYDSLGRPLGGPGALTVRTDQPQRFDGVAYDLEPPNALSVAYFPGSGMGEPPSDLLPAGARARIHLTINALSPGPEDDAVRLGLRAWLLLGGAGARTRRGAGALALRTKKAAEELGMPVSEEDLRVHLRSLCARRGALPGALDSVFSLGRTRIVLVGSPTETGEAAQARLLGALREARQDRNHPPSWDGRTGWGRSRWPEADAIRFFEDSGKYDHDPEEDNRGLYPRTSLGLPLGMKFKPDPGGREPLKHEVTAKLNGEADEPVARYSSPILLRPVRVWNGSSPVYLPVAVFTDCLLPESARPWVRPDDRRPRDEADLVDYAIRQNANDTLERVEGVFQRLGFRPL